MGLCFWALPFCSCNIFVFFWYQSNVCLIKWVRGYSLCFCLSKEVVYYWHNFFPTCLVKFTCGPIWACADYFGRLLIIGLFLEIDTGLLILSISSWVISHRWYISRNWSIAFWCKICGDRHSTVSQLSLIKIFKKFVGKQLFITTLYSPF